MNMNIALLLTASAISLNTASSAGSVISPPRSDGPEFMTIESDQSDAAVSATIYTPVSALPSAQSISAGNGSFEARLDLMMTDLPVDAGNAAMAPIAALPNDEIPLAPAQTALASVVVTDAVATMPAALLPVIAAETLPAMGASLAVMPIPKIATEQAAALPDVAPVMDATPVANPVEQAALVITALPKSDAAEAVFLHPVSAHSAAKMAPAIAPPMPQYTFFEDAPVPAVSPISAAAAGAGMVYGSENVTLEQAISAALETNPEVNQAIMNKEAIEFEREQAQGLYLPRVDIEASAGVRRLENNTRRSLGISDEVLYPLEAGISAEQVVVDFGRRHGELMRQAARTDGAALRVAERSENIGLLVTRQYLDILLQQRIAAAADDNVTFHRNLVRDLGQGVQQGSISIADQQQAQERMQAAVVRKIEAEEALANAQIALQTLTGLSVNSVTVPGSKRAALVPTVNDAIAKARQDNPKVLEAMADVDAAHGMIEKANGDLHPVISLDARGRIGEDIDGFRGETNDVQARVVFKWNIFDGGINRAKFQEMTRRASESRFRLHELVRYAEEDVRRAWNSMSTQDKVGSELEVQSRVSDDLLISYREQFNVGRRSLLDVLDAQNTRYNVQVRLETARFAEQFAEYQVLAATNELLDSMGLDTPAAAKPYAREKYNYGPSLPAETDRRRYPR